MFTVMPAIFVIATCFALTDLLWWLSIHRHLRALPRPAIWQAALALFMATMFLYAVAVVCGATALRRSQSPVPLPIHIAAYLWHFIVMPAATLAVLAVILFRQARALIRKKRSGVNCRPPEAIASAPGATASGESGREVLPSPGTPGEARVRVFSPEMREKRPSPQPSPGVPGEGARPKCDSPISGLQAPVRSFVGSAPRTIISARRETVRGADPTLIAQGDFVPARPTRRQMLAAGAMALPPVATAAISLGAYETLYGRRIRRFNLALPELPPQLDGMTITHVSDTHIGKFLHPSRLPAIAEDINRLNSDFILFTGDLIDLSLQDLPAGIRFLKSLKSRCGMAICEGNHDIMEHRGDFEDGVRNAGLPLIIGGQLALPYFSTSGQHFPVQILAVPWNMTDAFMSDAAQLLAPQVDPAAFPILLAHHPHYFDYINHAGLPLVLSGHTHGGQIMLTKNIGAGALRFRYLSGLYQKYGSNLIVNNGLGNWFPLRVNAPAEIVHITLRGSA